ncbi:MFS transporter [Aspergillus luchuensis]|uniref:MFS transporter n=1 Tax=Aspergillus kawachii TaxID=1069201 RepID=A0A146FGV9_ASPKA|nr:MFS transporter [Aspergillus luchuensis]
MTDSKLNAKLQDPEKSIPVTTKVDDVDIGQITHLDEAEIFLHEHGISHDQMQEMLDDPVRTKKLRRRIDMILLPLMCGTYCLQYIDKQALSYSAVFDLFTNAHINSYLFWEYPASYIAQRLPIGTIVSSFVIAWGSILMITAACNNFTGLAICRFLLGCFESPITPCFMMIVGMWYLRQEQPFRAGIFYCCNGVGSMVGGLLTYAIGQLNTFPVWRAVFLICGGATIIWGVVMMIFLPNSILSSKRFTVEEKVLLIGRGRKNQTGILNRSIKWYQIREAFIDPQVWLLFLFTLLNETINGGVANFGKLIIKGLVTSPLLTTVLGIPQGAFQVLFILTGTYLSTRIPNIRTLIMILYLIPTVIGIGSFVTSLVLALQLPSSNMGGYTKRVTATAFVFLAYCIGNIIGPHAFLASEAPVYQTGWDEVMEDLTDFEMLSNASANLLF